MIQSKTQICYLNISDAEKKLLSLTGMPRTIYDVVAKITQEPLISLSFAYNKLNVFKSKGWIREFRSEIGKKLYKLNEDVLIL